MKNELHSPRSSLRQWGRAVTQSTKEENNGEDESRLDQIFYAEYEDKTHQP